MKQLVLYKETELCFWGRSGVQELVATFRLPEEVHSDELRGEKARLLLMSPSRHLHPVDSVVLEFAGTEFPTPLTPNWARNGHYRILLIEDGKVIEEWTIV